jgi:hypothetical protein
MCVCDDDLLHREAVLLEKREDGGDLVSGIDDDGFARDLIAHDGAIALERTDGKNFVDHIGGSRC